MPQQALTRAPIEIILPQDFYTVKNVWLPYANRVCDVQVTTQLLDGDRPGAQSEWADYRASEASGGWGPGSGPLITAVLTSLYEQQGVAGVDKLKKLFAADFRRVMVTSTKVTYRPSGLDGVTHDFGSADAQSLEARLVGPDGYFGDVASGEVSEALLGEKNPKKAAAVYQWVTGHNPKLWRFNRQPEQDTERAFVLGYDFISGYFGADVSYDRFARGVRIAPQDSTPDFLRSGPPKSKC